MSVQKLYTSLARLHDLWIILAWGGILAAIFLNTFYNRNCLEFTTQRFSNATCQSGLDWALIFLTAVGGGATVWDERAGFLGFLAAHATASVLFVAALSLPLWLGIISSTLAGTVLSQAIVVVALSQFPFGLFFSFFGSLLGMYFGGKLTAERQP